MTVHHPGILLLQHSPYLAAAARAEVRSRENHYPDKVRSGAIERTDALADLAAWRTIAALFACSDAGQEVDWATLELATARALASRAEACEAAPGDRQLADRRETVLAIHGRVAWHRWYWTDIKGAPPAFPTASVANAA